MDSCWIGGQNENWGAGDGDLYFHVCKGSATGHDAVYIQDSKPYLTDSSGISLPNTKVF